MKSHEIPKDTKEKLLERRSYRKYFDAMTSGS